jgi:hypothetical protein
MEQRTAGERRRGGGLNPRGNAAGAGSDARTGIVRAGRFGDDGAGPRTGPERPTHGEPTPPPGRHRSPWGRPGRILPIRWGRIVAGCLVAAGVGAALVGFALVSRGGNSGRSAAGSSTASGRAPNATGGLAVLAPSSAGAVSPAGETSGVASPAPGNVDVYPTELTTAPPAPTAPPSAAVKVSPQPGPRPAGPVLSLARTSVDLGSVDSTDTVDLTDTGTAAVDFRIGGGLPAWLTAVPRATHLESGYRTQLVVTLDRATAPVGQLSVPIEVTPAQGSGGGTIHVSAQVTSGPTIVSVAAPNSLRPSACATDEAPATGTLTVQVQDPVGMAGGSVAVTGPDGQSTTVSLALATTTDDKSTWTARLGPSTAGTLGYTVTVKDLNNRTASRQGSLAVGAC